MRPRGWNEDDLRDHLEEKEEYLSWVKRVLQRGDFR